MRCRFAASPSGRSGSTWPGPGPDEVISPGDSDVGTTVGRPAAGISMTEERAGPVLAAVCKPNGIVPSRDRQSSGVGEMPQMLPGASSSTPTWNISRGFGGVVSDLALSGAVNPFSHQWFPGIFECP